MQRAQGIEDSDAPVSDLNRFGRGQGRFAALEGQARVTDRQAVEIGTKAADETFQPLQRAGVLEGLRQTGERVRC